MAYNEKLTNRIRLSLSHLTNVEEKKMFGGLCFMVNDKMCVGVSGEEMLCRIDPEIHKESIKKLGCRTMEMGGRQSKGFVFINEEGMKTNKDFEYWIGLALDYNERAKASSKKKKSR